MKIGVLFSSHSDQQLKIYFWRKLSNGKEKIGNSLYNGMTDFSKIIDKVLHTIIIPLLPLYICGTFTDMTKSGKTFAILGILWKVFIVVIIMHLVCITIQFTIAGTVNKKNPFRLIKNQIPGYTTALGTQSFHLS